MKSDPRISRTLSAPPATPGREVGDAVKGDLKSIPRTVSNIDTELVYLSDVCSELEARLAPVLGAEGPQCGEIADSKMVTITPLADTLVTFQYRINGVAMRLRAITDRLEI